MQLRREFFVFVCVSLASVALSQNLPLSTPQPFSLMRCTPLPMARQMHGAAVVGNRLYVLGGIEHVGGWTGSVISAPILKGGALGPWRQERPMPELRNYISQSVEVVNDRIYVVGGGVVETTNTQEDQLTRAKDVLWTRVNRDGTFQRWWRSEPFTETPASCIATASNEKHIFVVGGSLETGVSDRVIVGDFAPDGSPFRWRNAASLPLPLWFHGAAILEDRLYVWGGLTEKSKDAINEKVYSAAVLDDGQLGPWRQETPMPAPTYSSAFCGFNCYLVGVGGRYKGAVYTNAIWYARLEADGRVGAWQVLTSDLESRVYHALGLDKLSGAVYVMGGQYKDANTVAFGRMLASVQAFQIAQPRERRLEVKTSSSSAAPAPSQAASPAAPSTASTEASSTFVDLQTALGKARQTGRNILLILYSPEVPSCKRFWDEVVQTPAFASATQGVIVAVENTKESDEAMRRYSLYKVPAAALLDSNGRVINTTLRLREIDDIKALLKK